MHGLTLAPAVRENFDPECQACKNNAPAVTLAAIPPSSMTHLRRDAVWRGNDLCLGRRVIASIVADPVWPKMWRVEVGGWLTDMVNRTRARDAALSLAPGGAGA